MTDGLILLGFLALLVTIAMISVRRRLGLGVTSRSIAVTFTGFVIVVLVAWVAATK